MKKIKIFCTIGPRSLNPKTLFRLEQLGVDLFRINLSHTAIKDIEPTIVFIQKHAKVPVCLDTEGAQIRTGGVLGQERFLKNNETFLFTAQTSTTAANAISLQPAYVLKQLVVGDLLSLDFNSVLVQVISISKGKIQAKVLSEGMIGANKAVTLHRHIDLEAVTPKDKIAVKIGKKYGITNYALSFANTAADVRYFRGIVGKKAQIIAKIESKKGHANLKEILHAANGILIDRGDLSREIPLSLIPFYQKHIIKEANHVGKEVYVATNLLESMREQLTPTRAEVHDVVNTLMMGADGLVLAAETAIGKWPIESAAMIRRLIDQFNVARNKDIIVDENDVVSSLIEPHGGSLVLRVDQEPDMKRIVKLPKLTLNKTAQMDVEQICLGTFSPLCGFMNEADLNAVLDNYRLANQVVWTMPILLQKFSHEIVHIKKGDVIALVRDAGQEIFATMTVNQKYKIDLDQVCLKWFGTNDNAHPGVSMVKAQGNHCLAGELTLIKRQKSAFLSYEFTPAEYRRIFEARGWSKVVGFHTRNVPHRGHEMIQKKALEMLHCDGLLISPLTGPKKKGDFKTEAVLAAYEALINSGHLPSTKVLLGGFPTYARYAGPREAVFTALCRKNYGCSHFIMGRDHTGVGKYYHPKAAHELFQSLDNIGIEPIFFDEVVFCEKCQDHVFFCAHDKSYCQYISGTLIRDMIDSNQEVPLWLLRPQVGAAIDSQKKIFKGVFVK